MKTKLLTILMLLSLQVIISQKPSKSVTKFLKEQEEQQKKDFPEPLTKQFEKGTLGEELQKLYELQAKNSCGITRIDKRLYIPKEIITGYGEDRLRNTMIYNIPLRATNLLFLTLTPSDINKISNGNFVEDEYIKAKRIIGLNDNLINFGHSTLSPIDGFPSLFYQKSCGSYFTGNITTKVNVPIAELAASLDAETKKSASITSVTGNFFSPLYIILRQNTAQSTYAHLLLWEVYYEDYKQNPSSSEPLNNYGKYISEFNGTLTYRAIKSEESIAMNGKLSANISYGILSATGNINSGNENNAAFDLKDFSTSIHKLNNGNLSWDLTDLPRIEQINQKLENYINHKSQSTINGFVTHLLPTEITKTVVGVPASLCDKNSWYIITNGFDSNIWRDKPNVISTWVKPSQNNELPECICKVTGFIKKEAIDNATSRTNGFIDLVLKLNNKAEINNQKLNLVISEKDVRVTDNPKVSNINSELVNATKEETKVSNKTFYNFPIQFTINATGIQLTEPYKIYNIEIEYLNAENKNQLLSINNDPIIKGNSVKLVLTSEKPVNSTPLNDIIVPVKIKFNIEIQGGRSAQLVTNTINLNLPNLAEPVVIKSNLKD